MAPRGISKDQKVKPKGSPDTAKDHQYRQHNQIMKAKKSQSKTRVS
ncbi:MAG: hypothetical protein ACYSUV_17235 [Planctomycetota bacterium]|jgi:hypothetical protein